MSLAHLYNITVTVNRPTVTQGTYGEEVKVWAAVSSNVQAMLQLKKTVGETENDKLGRLAVESDYILYCDPDTTIAATDRVVYGTRTFEVVRVDDEIQIGHHLRVRLLEMR